MVGVGDELAQRLSRHLQDVGHDPSTPLDEKLLEECEMFPDTATVGDAPQCRAVVSQISEILPQLQQDPKPLVNLLLRLIESFSLPDILRLDPPVDFVSLLDPSAQSFNLLGLRLLDRAADRCCDVAHLANMPAVVKALVNLWMTTPDARLANEASQVLERLMTKDKEPLRIAGHGVGDNGIHGSRGQRLMWRRLFSDKDIYGLILNTCSLSNHDSPQLEGKRKTLSQARLMALAPKLGALDWDYLQMSHHPIIESACGLNANQEGLIDFIAVHMVDTKGDVLMHLNLIQFFTELISTVKTSSNKEYVVCDVFIAYQKSSTPISYCVETLECVQGDGF